MKYIVILWCCLFSTMFASDSLQLAQQYYQNQDYERALVAYEEAYTTSPDSVSLLYNLGNTHFKLNNYGYAIAFYRKALYWNPLDSDTLYNLRLAREFVVDDSSSTPYERLSFFTLMDFLSTNIIFYTLMVCLLTVFICLYFKPSSSRFSFLLKQLLVPTIFLSSIILLLFLGSIYKNSQHYGVITSKKVSVHSGPSDTLPILFYIHEGHELKISKVLNQWTEVTLSNGFKGWILDSDIITI